MNDKAPRGFTLVELLVTITVMSLLAALVYPMYVEQVRKTRRAEGWALLVNAAQQQERFYTANNAYTATVGSGGLGMSTGATVTSPNGYYTLTAALGAVASGASTCTAGGGTACYILTATAQGDQRQDKDQGKTCFSLTLDSLNNKNSTSNGTTANGSPTGGSPYCWSK
ncbi:type IV pilin protein [uncultured Thiodictyon sp.]|uniref:type IV pilin protein n=1 Tax=uncultured Thiodictyon sp. TaxID=1846217 RepID=UPI0025CC26D8|nr:type IV pilin protein [uncultured Thiodictyon sp.]